MNPADILVFMIIGSITFTAFILVTGSLFPARTDIAKEIVRSALWKSFFLGLVNFIFFFILAFVLFQTARNEMRGILAGIVALIALTILGFLFILASIGLSGFNQWFREQLGLEGGLSNALRSTFLLVVASLAPFVGWFLLTPFVLAISLGAGIQAMFRKKEKAA